MKKIKYLLLLIVMLFVFSGCDQSAVNNWTKQLAENIKKAFMETWYIWLIIALVIGFVSVMVTIAKNKARVKMAKYVKDKIDKKRKK